MRGRPRVRSIIPQRARSKGATERVIPDKLGEKKADTPAAGYLGGLPVFGQAASAADPDPDGRQHATSQIRYGSCAALRVI